MIQSIGFKNNTLTPGSDYDEVLRYKPDTSSFEGYFHNEFNQFSTIEPGRVV